MSDKKFHFLSTRPNRHDQNGNNSENLQRFDELKFKKRFKLIIFVAVFLVFHVFIGAVFALTVMKVHSPKLRLAKIEVENFVTTNNNNKNVMSTFDINFSTQIRIRNPNFGLYNYENTHVNVMFGNNLAGKIWIAKGKTEIFKSTKKINNVVVNLTSAQLNDKARLDKELTSGTLTFSSKANMTGNVELMMIVKKKRFAVMNCTIVFDVASKSLKDLKCK